MNDYRKPANNTIYFKAWNVDYRLGGQINKLSTTTFKAYVTLLAYVNPMGELKGHNGRGYYARELAAMTGLSEKTLPKAIDELIKARLVRSPSDKILIFTNFVDDQNYREKEKGRVEQAREYIEKNTNR